MWMICLLSEVSMRDWPSIASQPLQHVCCVFAKDAQYEYLNKPHFPADELALALLFSPKPHAKILSIDKSAAEAMSGVKLVLTAEDICEVNNLRGPDKPFLAYREVGACTRTSNSTFKDRFSGIICKLSRQTSMAKAY